MNQQVGCCGGGCCDENTAEMPGYFPVIGETVPNLEFDYYHQEGFHHSHFSDYRGKWVVVFFYPGDFTFVCPTELQDLAVNYEKFTTLGAEILSVSTDSKHVHKAWHDQSVAVKQVQFPMLADPSGDISDAFGVLIQDSKNEDYGRTLRGTFLIDPDGVLQACEIHANNVGRSADELLRKLEAAIFVREHHGEVCPASWKKGAKTLKPGIDLVGKI